jgi:hypothetical protein
MVTGRLKALRRTKLYDLFAAAPLIAWYLFCAVHMLPSLADQVALVELFVRTDPSVLPAFLVARELVATRPDVIVGATAQAALWAQLGRGQISDRHK